MNTIGIGGIFSKDADRALRAFAGLKSHHLASVNEKMEFSPAEPRVTGDLFLGMSLEDDVHPC